MVQNGNANTAGPHYAKILVYGDSGTGKTTSCSLLENVHFIYTESQAIDQIKAINPNSICHKVNTVEDAWTVIEHLHKLRHAGECDGTEWVVLDTLTDFDRMAKSEVKLRKKGKPLVFADWGEIMDNTDRLARAMRDLPYNTICLCLPAKVDHDEMGRFKEPALTGKDTSENICSMFNVVAYLHKIKSVDNEDKTKIIRYAMLDGDDNIRCKPGRNLNETEYPNYAEWWERMQDDVDVNAIRNSMFGYVTDGGEEGK